MVLGVRLSCPARSHPVLRAAPEDTSPVGPRGHVRTAGRAPRLSRGPARLWLVSRTFWVLLKEVRGFIQPF